MVSVPRNPKKRMHDTDSIRKAVRKRAAENNSQLMEGRTSILQALPIAVIVFDSDLRIIEANSTAASLIKLSDRIDQSLSIVTDDKIGLDWTKQLKAVISERDVITFDNVNYTSDQGTKSLKIICSVLENVEAAGRPGGIAVIEDMSEKVALQKKLSDAERLAVIGKRASKVAHELNNPLDGIMRYINLTMRFVEQEDLKKPKEYLIHCRKALMRMIRIVRELLEFSRVKHIPLEHVKIEQLIEDAIDTIEQRAVSLKVKITRNYAAELPAVLSGNLFQVFCNLAKNALDAMPDGGELIISTRQLINDTIAVEFQDTGPGLPPVDPKAIFEPFFTTKGRDNGTGLGLAICRDIIESYRGRITAENAPGGGSLFTVYLPVASQSRSSIE